MKIKLKYSDYIKLFYSAIIIIFVIIFAFLFDFLQINLHQIFSPTEIIKSRSKEISAEAIKINMFEEVRNHIEKKQNKSSLEIKEIKNIFTLPQNITTNDSPPPVNLEPGRINQ